MKKVVVPGELISEERKKIGENVFVREGKIYSSVLGLTDESSPVAGVVPLEGSYRPAEGDLIVGVVEMETFAGYLVNINTHAWSFLSKESLREPLKPGSIVSAQVARVNEVNEVDLDRPRVFYGGEIIKATPVKVPRIIGKNGSMLNVLKDGTKSSLMVGRNGFVWAKGGNTALLARSLEKIQKEAHHGNLTNSIESFLKKEGSEK